MEFPGEHDSNNPAEHHTVFTSAARGYNKRILGFNRNTGGIAMGFQTEFNSVCKFKSDQELYELLEYGRGKMVKKQFRVFPTGQKVIAYNPTNQAVAIVRIVASIAEINFQGEEVTQVEMELVRRLTEEEARVQTALAHEMFFGEQS
ncbi:hypothetical protein DFP95_104100 [Cohnella lupini]|uniref:Uncharacterized protein n=2 Tax=Cohnella lupini TaxID=1294267 RepID=A0A3D9IPV2_9BACL|nr:hypothetical protein DFP95_104100 [Cohnella lupini]